MFIVGQVGVVNANEDQSGLRVGRTYQLRIY